MNAVALRIYVHQTRKHHGVILFDWILGHAKAMGIHGGSAFCATAGFGRHGIIHEQRFVELAADLTIVVEFIITRIEADALIELLRREKISVFCTLTGTEVLLLDGD